MDQAPGHHNRSEEPHCYNCGASGHWVIACPEPTRATPAGLTAWRKSSKGNGHGQGREHHNGPKKSKGPIITKYAPPPPPVPSHSYYPTPPGHQQPPSGIITHTSIRIHLSQHHMLLHHHHHHRHHLQFPPGINTHLIVRLLLHLPDLADMAHFYPRGRMSTHTDCPIIRRPLHHHRHLHLLPRTLLLTSANIPLTDLTMSQLPIGNQPLLCLWDSLPL
ncbi:hypothetical protein B0I35DRAFT_478148 [Stachybotrys elegans]|uniref:CCHC-type domain-containing protein n=1 Tax=Stachybotrys elegans TaxID=80388 RepID=A0A8K0SND0_9HYPO|nr:hypothetical protein B0I35DRAFT_478148 [Stachybotrys elegans]